MTAAEQWRAETRQQITCHHFNNAAFAKRIHLYSRLQMCSIFSPGPGIWKLFCPCLYLIVNYLLQAAAISISRPARARVSGNKSVKNAEIWNYLPDLGEDINFNQLKLIFIIDFLAKHSIGLIYIYCCRLCTGKYLVGLNKLTIVNWLHV